MKLYKAEAVVLRARSLREADQLLVLYSKQHGKINVAAHGVCKPSSRKRGAVQPFCYSHFLLHKGRQLDSVSQCEGIEIFPHLRSDLSLLSYASYLAELVESLTTEEQPNEYVFMLLISTFYLLSSIDAELLTRAFEIKIISALGFRPSLEACVSCAKPLKDNKIYFSPASGGALCPACAHRNTKAGLFSRGALEILKILLSWEPSRLSRLKTSAVVRGELKKIMLQYLNYHMEYRLKSTRFLDLIQTLYKKT